MINIWLTLDLIAGSDLRSRSDGLQDFNNLLKVAGLAGKQRASELRRDSSDDYNLTSSRSAVFSSAGRKSSLSDKNKKTARQRKRRRVRKKEKHRIFDEKIFPDDYDNIIDCSFNIPRISARLEKLMGTNVVRLTDRKYMQLLRQRIQEDYIATLAKRIQSREIQELDRVRSLILEGKSNIITPELADHPIFQVNKKVEEIVQKRRAKLKTVREKNAEHLLRQCAKWEREHGGYQQIGQQKEDELKKLREEQKMLEQQYKQEDEKRGMDLLRIHDTEFKECEQELKEFLENERMRMKAHSMRVPEQFISDPLDIVNIIKRRRMFREAQKKLRQEMEEAEKAQKETKKSVKTKDVLKKAEVASKVSRKVADQSGPALAAIDSASMDIIPKSLTLPRLESLDNLSMTGMHPPHKPLDETEFLNNMSKEIERDIQQNLLLPKERFNVLQYTDPKVEKLKNARDIQGLYELAEVILTGADLPVEGEEEEEEEET